MDRPFDVSKPAIFVVRLEMDVSIFWSYIFTRFVDHTNIYKEDSVTRLDEIEPLVVYCVVKGEKS